MVPALIDAIKSHGLALVIDRSGEELAGSSQQQQQQNQLGVPSMVDPFGSSSSSGTGMVKLPKGVDGLLRSNGVLRFTESIDV